MVYRCSSDEHAWKLEMHGILKKDHTFIYYNVFCNLYSKGFGRDQVTQKLGVRWSTYKAFIEPVLHRSNLHVSQYSIAEKVSKFFTSYICMKHIV